MTTGTELELYRKVGEDGHFSGFDEKLLEFARQRMTGEQMSEALSGAVSPARCVQRVREIVRSQDILSVNEQKALLILDLVKLRELIFERLNGLETKITREGIAIDVLPDAAHYRNALTLIREFRGVIESMEKSVDSTRVMIRESHARAMVDSFEPMLAAYHAKLKLLGYEVPNESDARDMFEEVMPIGFKALEPHIAS